MDDALIEEAASPERASLLPGAGFFVPDSVSRERSAAAAADALEGADVVVVADPDADGLACVALIREVVGEAALVGTAPHELERGLRRVAAHAEAGADLYVCDLCPDDPGGVGEALEAVGGRLDRIRWFDHHRWDPAVESAVREAGVDLEVGDSEAECTADVAARALGGDLPDHLIELVAVTRDHDLWIRDDPRSDDLADYARWADADEYVATVRDHGPDLPEAALSLLEERRVEKADRIDRAHRRAELHDVAGVTVGVTYGRCSQNEVAERLREDGADAAVVVKPAGSASIRGTEAFDRCHEVAGRLGGGGHPKAAGCKPDVYDDMLDFARHWTTEGAVAKRTILEAFRAVAADAD